MPKTKYNFTPKPWRTPDYEISMSKRAVKNLFELELRASAQLNGITLDHSEFVGMLERIQHLMDTQIRRIAASYDTELKKELDRVQNENRLQETSSTGTSR